MPAASETRRKHHTVSTPQHNAIVDPDAIAPTLAVLAAWREIVDAGVCECGDPGMCESAGRCLGGNGDANPFGPVSLSKVDDAEDS